MKGMKSMESCNSYIGIKLFISLNVTFRGDVLFDRCIMVYPFINYVDPKMGNTQRMTQKITRKERGKQHKYQLKYQNIPYQNQNFISISRKNIVPLCGFSEKMKCGCKIWAGKSYYI